MFSDGSNIDLPVPPPAVLELRSLEKRYGEMVEWVIQATADAYLDRSRDFFKIQLNQNPNFRVKEGVAICDRLSARLAEIDSTEEKFKRAYESVKASLDHDVIIEYACLIKPIIDKKEKENNKRRAEERLEKAREKSQLLKEREERKRQRQKKKEAGRISGKRYSRDRDLSQADRTQKAPDEGARSGALADDRGFHGSSGRDQDSSQQADANEGS